jgi:anti-sigma-K factor RskA
MSGPDAMRNLTCDEVRELAGAYVLGALEPAEAAAVRSHLTSHPDGHPEIAEVGAVVPALAEIVPIVEPPDGLKTRIMAAAAADLAARGGSAGTVSTEVPFPPASDGEAAPAERAGAPATAAPAERVSAPATAAPAERVSAPATAAPVAFPGPEERDARRARTSPVAWVLRIAAVLAIALLGGWNLLLQNDLGAARQYEQNVAAVLEAASQPGALTAVLAAEGGTGSGLAAVDADGDIALAMRDLAPTSGDAVYEAWVIAADGVPVPLGSFQVGDNGTAFFEGSGLPSAEGIVLALTLEPGPGATTPTMPIISAGVAAAPG